MPSDFLPYLEPCGLLGLRPNPPDGSTDNGLLFTATWAALDPRQGPHLQLLVARCEVEAGCFSRWPLTVQTPEVSHWDDHLGVSCVSMYFAERVLAYGQAHHWTWNGQFLARILDFAPAVTMAAGQSAGLFGRGLACLGLLWNLTEPKGETSGKCLLWLKARVYDRQPRWQLGLRLCTWLWRRRCTRLYGDLSGLYAIYFGPDHPLTSLARGRAL